MPKRKAVISQIRSSRVTLKRVTTNQPEKIVTDNAAQTNPLKGGRHPRAGISAWAAVPMVNISPLAIIQAERSGFRAARIASGSSRLR